MNDTYHYAEFGLERGTHVLHGIIDMQYSCAV